MLLIEAEKDNKDLSKYMASPVKQQPRKETPSEHLKPNRNSKSPTMKRGHTSESLRQTSTAQGASRAENGSKF